MGDRGNIFVIDPDAKAESPDLFAGVYLYTHWSGSEIAADLRAALDSPAGRSRWSDGSYLTRIIFDRMSAGQQGGETGYGISCSISDNSHPILVVHPGVGAVRVAPEGTERDRGAEDWVPFEDFIKSGT